MNDYEFNRMRAEYEEAKAREEIALKKECQNIIEQYRLNCTLDDFDVKAHWGAISAAVNLSDAFIRYFADKLNWWAISKYQNLSENMIREFQDKVNWVNIFNSQKISDEFRMEFKPAYENQIFNIKQKQHEII